MEGGAPARFPGHQIGWRAQGYSAGPAPGRPRLRPPSAWLPYLPILGSPRLTNRSGPWPSCPRRQPQPAYLPFCSPRLLCWTGPWPSTPQAAPRLATIPSCSRQPQANQQDRPLAVLSPTTAPGWHTYLYSPKLLTEPAFRSHIFQPLTGVPLLKLAD
ncbi:Hypp8489 [Branchiostoma lanceolatum]|uniref:Hypp8489 protein n=1 Tax=Branchiostoma lanceolatum TaxID=7740 RepID=A0A8J9Z6Y3_BRALA|nr:Hypp8489 [Branchiostoma lanceolatum]